MRLPPPPGRLFDIGTHRLHLDVRGSGDPPVIFDAALGASSLSWTYVAREVASFTRACAYDRAGFGWSEAGPLPRTAERIADELRRLMAAAGIAPPFVVVGHSFGGLVARILASRHPGEVAGLVLLDPAHPEDWLDPTTDDQERLRRGVVLCRYAKQAARFGIADLVAALVRVGAYGSARLTALAAGRGALRRMDEAVLAPAAKLPPELRAITPRFWTQPRFYEALGSQIGSLCESARSVRLDQEFDDTPLVVVSGDTNTGERQRARQAALATRSRRGRHVLAEGSGHWIPLDRPDVVVAAVREVVDLVRGDQGVPGR
jgi:pimeloyl-ACP methyl ester carboxylesterase